MALITRVNPPNDFWQTFIKYGCRNEELMTLGFSQSAIDWNSRLNEHFEQLNFALEKFPTVINFIKKQIDVGKILFIKTHPQENPVLGSKEDFCYYISFGDYPDETVCDALSLRLDQSWEGFNIPSFIPSEIQRQLLSQLPYLSGAVIGSLETPPILAERHDIANGEIGFSWKVGGKIALSSDIIENLKKCFRIGRTYYGWVFLVDEKGWISEWDSTVHSQFVVKPTKMSYLEWIQKDLSNPFRPYSQWR